MRVAGRFNHYDLHLIGAVDVHEYEDGTTEINPDVNLSTLNDSVAMQALRASAIDADNTSVVQNDHLVKLLFEVLFDHENRLRTLAGQPTITRNQYRNGLLTVWRNL